MDYVLSNKFSQDIVKKILSFLPEAHAGFMDDEKIRCCWNRFSYLEDRSFSGKNKVRDSDGSDTALAPPVQKKRSQSPLTDEALPGVQPLNIVTCGIAAGQPVSIGKHIAGDNRGDVDGTRVAAANGNTGHEALEPNDTEPDDSEEEEEEEDDEEYDPIRYPEIGFLDVEEIDADWLQRKFSKFCGVDMGLQLADEVFNLLEKGNDLEAERLMDRASVRLGVILTVLGNRWIIVWCTRLARAQNQVERNKIENEMKALGGPHQLVLKQLRAAKRSANGKQTSM